MEYTKARLKQLIKEEMKLMELEQGEQPTQEAEDNPKVQDLKQKLVKLSTNISGIQANEVDIVNLFINLIDLAKRENVNLDVFKRRLELVKKVAEKISK